MNLIPLPAFQDNYLWVLHDGHRALAAGPGDALPVPHRLQRDGLQLEAILVKQHHPDLIDGTDTLRGPPWNGLATDGARMDRVAPPFCGDTLFSDGCGQLFENTPAQMPAPRHALDRGARIRCTHEYTLRNLAQAAEPGKLELIHYSRGCEELRGRSLPILPSTVDQEGRINPFLRARLPGVVQAERDDQGAPLEDDIAVSAVIRQRKNEFE